MRTLSGNLKGHRYFPRGTDGAAVRAEHTMLPPGLQLVVHDVQPKQRWEDLLDTSKKDILWSICRTGIVVMWSQFYVQHSKGSGWLEGSF